MRAGPGVGHWCRREHPYSLRCMARPPCTATDASETVRLTSGSLPAGPVHELQLRIVEETIAMMGPTLHEPTSAGLLEASRTPLGAAAILRRLGHWVCLEEVEAPHFHGVHPRDLCHMLHDLLNDLHTGTPHAV